MMDRFLAFFASKAFHVPVLALNAFFVGVDMGSGKPPDKFTLASFITVILCGTFIFVADRRQ